MSLTPAQTAAVLTRSPLVLNLAAPGSGKTRTLTARIVRLLDEGVHPTEILALTFTRRAAREMRERLIKAKEDTGARWSAKRVVLSTFHSWALTVLREFHDVIGWPPGFTVRDERDRIDVFNYRAVELDPKIKPCTSQDGRARRAKAQAKDPAAARLYRRMMRESGAMDYDMLEEELLGLLRDHLEVADELRRRLQHVLVDEGQDTSTRQQEILGHLAPPNRFDVGDPGQSVYSFRGANMAGFLALSEITGCEVINLDTNWRSDPEIVECVSRCAAAMTPQGLLQVAGRPAGKGGAVACLAGQHGDALRAAIIADLQAVHAEGIAWEDCAVLAPQWLPLTHLAEALQVADIPYHCPKTETSTWNSDEARWLINLLRVAVQPGDHLALWSVLSHAEQRVRMWDWAPMRSEALRGGEPILSVALGRARESRLGEGASDLVLAMGAIRGCVAEGQHATAISGALEVLRAELHRLHLSSRLVDLAEVGKALQTWMETAEDPTVPGLLDWFTEREIGDEEAAEAEGGRVSLLSIHAAKGLEFRAVWALAEEGQLPRTANPGPAMEEERRVFYVASSRAIDRLRWCWRQERGGPSRFIAEALGREVEPLPAELLDADLPF